MAESTTVARQRIDGARTYATRTTSPLRGCRDGDDEARAAALRQRAAEGFVTSAYWGATGTVAPREADDVAGKHPHRFVGEVSGKLVPLPATSTSIPRVVDYTLCGLHVTRNKGVGVSDRGGLNASQLSKLLDAQQQQQPSSSSSRADGDALGSGEARSRHRPPFLEVPLSTTHRNMQASFDPDVLRARDAGDAHDAAQRARLAALRAAPPTSGDVDAYRLTSDDYCDFSPLDPSVAHVTECRLPVGDDARSGSGSGDNKDNDEAMVYRSRYDNVEHRGPPRRARAAEMLRRERAVDEDALRRTLRAMHEAALPANYTPACTDDWLSTTHREHAAYDVAAAQASNDAHATLPLRNTHYTLTPAHEEAVAKRDARAATRRGDATASEYTASYKKSVTGAALPHSVHGHTSIFDIRDGIYTMDKRYHHPRNDTATGEAYTPAQLVPGQYTTMSQEPLHARNTLPRQ